MELKQGDDEEKRMAERELNVHHVTQRRKLDDLECEFSKPGIVPRLWHSSENAFASGNHATIRAGMTRHFTSPLDVLLCLWVELISGVQVKD